MHANNVICVQEGGAARQTSRPPHAHIFMQVPAALRPKLLDRLLDSDEIEETGAGRIVPVSVL